MPSVNFYLDKPFQGRGKNEVKILNKRETMLYLFVTYPGRKIIKESTGQKVLPKDWNFETKNFKSITPGSLAFNTRLACMKSEVLQSISKATDENPDIILPQLKEIVATVLSGKKPKFDKKNFMQHLEDFIEERTMLNEERTIRKFRSFANVMLEYLDFKGIKPESFYFESIDHDFEIQFKKYLIHERGNLNNTISKAFETLAGIMNWGLRKKYHKNTAFQEFASIPKENSEVIFLELEEIRSLQSLHLSGKEDLVRDVFLFALYAGGQRISDALHVKIKDIEFNDDKTELSWNLYQKKGKKTELNSLPLLDVAVSFLMKYYDSTKDANSNIFPKISEYHINRKIKKLCNRAGITKTQKVLKYNGIRGVETVKEKSEFINFKSARKSFVSIALKLGMNPELIIRYTGHKTTKVMRQHYLGITQEFKREALFKLFQPENCE